MPWVTDPNQGSPGKMDSEKLIEKWDILLPIGGSHTIAVDWLCTICMTTFHDISAYAMNIF